MLTEQQIQAILDDGAVHVDVFAGSEIIPGAAVTAALRILAVIALTGATAEDLRGTDAPTNLEELHAEERRLLVLAGIARELDHDR